MKTILALLFAVAPLMAIGQTTAQTPDLPTNRVVVLGDARLELPADRAQISVTLRYTDPTDARKAYTAHKAAEQRLVKLLLEYQIAQKDITYTLLSVFKNINYAEAGQRREEVVTDQRIIFTLTDLKRYSDMQLALIGAGFNQFNAVFNSSKAEESKNRVLEKAVEVAREKAAIMAKAAGRTLGGVLSVRDTEETDPVLQRRYEEVPIMQESAARLDRVADAGLLDIPQKIIIPARVKVTFELR